MIVICILFFMKNIMRINEIISRPPDHCHCMDKTIYRSLVGNEYERLRGRERNLDKMGESRNGAR